MINMFLSRLSDYFKAPEQLGEQGRRPVIPWSLIFAIILLFAILAQILGSLQLMILAPEITTQEANSPFGFILSMSPVQLALFSFISTAAYFVTYLLLAKGFSSVPTHEAASSLIRFFIIQRILFLGLGIVGFFLSWTPGLSTIFSLVTLGVVIFIAIVSLGVAKGAFGFSSRWTSFGVAVMTAFLLSFIVSLLLAVASSMGMIDMTGFVGELQ